MQLNKDIPGHLKTDGALLWNQLVEEYRIDDAAGLALVGTACECMDRIRVAQGAFISNRYGQARVHSACALEKDSRNGFLVALKLLNLDIEPLCENVGRPPGICNKE